MHRSRSLVLVSSVLAAAMLAGCGGGASGAASPTGATSRSLGGSTSQAAATPAPPTGSSPQDASTGSAAATSMPEMEAVPAMAATSAPAAEAKPATMPTVAPSSEEGAPPPSQPVAVNPFVSTAEDTLSTFAMDVDTASYSAARNALIEGHLPSADSVRVEEFVNYFDYNYPSPQDGAFGVAIESAPSPFGIGDTQLVRIGLQGRRVDRAERKPAILTFVIDVSGSMQEPNRLPLVKQSLALLLNELREGDKVGIVAYGSRAEVVLEQTDVSQRDAILRSLDSLGDGGSTNAEEGLLVAYSQAAKYFNPEATNRVILCSDGVANVGATGPDAIRAAIRNSSEQNIYLTTVGFGMGSYNDYLMEQLADDGNGNYAYVDSLDEAQRVFSDSLTGTLEVIAKDAKIQVEFDPAIVASYRLLGYENRDVADSDFRNDKVDAGEVGAGHSVTALYELRLRDNAAGNALTVRLRYQDIQSNQVVELQQGFNSDQFGRDFTTATPQLQLAVGAAAFAEQLRGSYYAQDRPLDSAQTIANRVAKLLPENAEVQEFSRLVARAEELQ